MTTLAKILLAVIFLLLATNLFLLFEVHKINGGLANMRSAINQLEKNTAQNQNDIKAFKTGLISNYQGGN